MIVDIDKAGFEVEMMDLNLSKLPGVQLDKDENVVLEEMPIFKL
jgi:hypothetical protein